MKIFIPTTGVDRLKITQRLVKTDLDVTIVVQDPETMEDILAKRPEYETFRFISHRCPHTERIERIPWIRWWIEEHLVGEGEWYAMMDDKMVDVERYALNLWLEDPRESYERWGSEAFKELVRPCEYEDLLYDIKIRCIQQETVFGGVSCKLNPYFRLTPGRWETHQTIPGPLMVCQKTAGLSWMPFGLDKPWIHKEDVVRTAFVIDRYGSVVSDKWHIPYCPRSAVKDYYETGTGTNEYRAPWIARTKGLLKERFGDAISFKAGDISMAARYKKR